MEILYIIFGLIIGSFLSVCIYRIPLGRCTGLSEEDEEEEAIDDKDTPNSTHFESRVTVCYPPRSFCPDCGAQLLWWHNIPLISWILLRGKCSFCSARIPFRYPLIEILSALLCFLSFHTFGLTLTALLIYAFCCALLVISFIDIDYYIIPNVISYPATLIGLVIALVNQFSHIFKSPIVPDIKMSLLGILAGAGFLFLISECYLRLRKKQGLGMGDVKLLAVVGALFGPLAALYTIFIGSLLGSVLGILFIIFAGKKASHYLPFGPYLALASLIYVFSGSAFLDYIFKLLGG